MMTHPTPIGAGDLLLKSSTLGRESASLQVSSQKPIHHRTLPGSTEDRPAREVCQSQSPNDQCDERIRLQRVAGHDRIRGGEVQLALDFSVRS